MDSQKEFYKVGKQLRDYFIECYDLCKDNFFEALVHVLESSVRENYDDETFYPDDVDVYDVYTCFSVFSQLQKIMSTKDNYGGEQMKKESEILLDLLIGNDDNETVISVYFYALQKAMIIYKNDCSEVDANILVNKKMDEFKFMYQSLDDMIYNSTIWMGKYLEEDVEYVEEESELPEILYHATLARNVQSIIVDGLKAQNGNPVTLLDNDDSAISIAKRHITDDNDPSQTVYVMKIYTDKVKRHIENGSIENNFVKKNNGYCDIYEIGNIPSDCIELVFC